LNKAFIVGVLFYQLTLAGTPLISSSWSCYFRKFYPAYDVFHASLERL